jgi:hypothetical protein
MTGCIRKRVLGSGCWVLAYSSQTAEELASAWSTGARFWVLAYSSHTAEELASAWSTGARFWVLAYSSQTAEEFASTQHPKPNTFLWYAH